MAPDVPLSGAQWLDRITFDGFCHIVWFLDVRSVSMLASVSLEAAHDGRACRKRLDAPPN